MRLFDEVDRHDKGPARYAEPQFPYLNRSARAAFNGVRPPPESRWLGEQPPARGILLTAEVRK